MLKIVTLFLIFMAVLAMLGRLRWPGKGGTGGTGGKAGGHGLPRPRLCKECGRYNLRGGPCRQCSAGGKG